MRRLFAACALALALTTMAAPAEAKHSNKAHVSHRHAGAHHARHHRHYASRHHRRGARASLPTFVGLTTIDTAAGKITVAADGFANRMRGFIGDIVAAGIRPSKVHCYNLASSHVANSLHFSGHACDFNGSASRFPPMNRHRVSHIAAKWGLRDGCNFMVTVKRGKRRFRVPDCGHIDAGIGYARAHERRVRLAHR